MSIVINSTSVDSENPTINLPRNPISFKDSKAQKRQLPAVTDASNMSRWDFLLVLWSALGRSTWVRIQRINHRISFLGVEAPN